MSPEPRSTFDEKVLKELCSSEFGINNPYVFFRGDIKRKSAIILNITSQQADSVVEKIYSQHLRAAAEQFSGDRPAVICLNLADLTGEEVLTLNKDNNAFSEQVLKILTKRPYIYGVLATTNGEVKNTTSKLLYPSTTVETSPLAAFRNPAFISEKQADIFEKMFGF